MFCACQVEFLVSLTFLQAQDVSVIPFCKQIISWVPLQVVYCLSKDIEKSSTTSICGLLSNLFDVSLHSSLLLVPLHPVLLSFSLPLTTPSLNLCCYNLNPAYLKNSVTSLAAHMKKNFSLHSCLNGGINQSDKRKGKGFTACASSST